MSSNDPSTVQRAVPRATLSLQWFVAFSFLLLTVHEAHELAHAITAKLVCNEWPVRDFNAWRLSSQCSSWLPTAAGPVFSYLLMAVGSVTALRAKGEYRWLGIAVLFSANPFARIFTVAMGGGDEMIVGQRIADLGSRTPALRVIVFLIVTAVCGSAILVGWRSLSALKHRGLWFTVLLLWPMILTGLGLFLLGNGLLRAGILALPILWGAPLLVVLASVVFFLITLATSRWLIIAPRTTESPVSSSILAADS